MRKNAPFEAILRFSRGRLTELAKDERVREEDLKKLLDSQLSQQSQIMGFLVGILWGGILAAIVTKGIQLVSIFNIFTEPILEGGFIIAAAIGVAVGFYAAYFATSFIGFRFKIDLMKDYLEAREIVEQRERKKGVKPLP